VDRTTARAFRQRAFSKPGVEFGHANHVVGARGGEIVATGAACASSQ
jgi:hypothetical protein